MLTLPIKKQWFDMIKRGEKTEEYREIKPYYESRFKNNLSQQCILRNGYSANSPAILINYDLVIGNGKSEWGAETGTLYYVLRITKVESVAVIKCQH